MNKPKKIYLDNNIYIYLLNPSNQFGFEIEDLCEKLNGNSLLISIANCYEIAATRESERIIRALTKCKILYLPLAFQLQTEELTQYIFKNHFNHEYKPLLVCNYQSEIFTFIKPTPPIPLGGSLRDYIKMFSTEYLLNIKEVTEENWLKAAATLYGHRKKLPDRNLTNQTFENRMKVFLSSFRDPSGVLISESMKEEIIASLKKENEENPKRWPTLYIEDLFFDFRYKNDSRKPEKNDSRDIEHIICGLTSSDYFITCDKTMLRFCKYAKSFYGDKLPDYRDNLDFL